MSSVVNAIQTNYATASSFTIAAGSFLALVTTEMALRTLYDGYQMTQATGGREFNRAWKSFGTNLGGTLFYGMLATNLAPGGPLIGATIFTVYSAMKYEKQDTYFITKTIGPIAHTICKTIANLAWNTLIVLKDCFSKFFDCVYNIVNAISLPRHPIWIGVALVAIAILITQLHA